ncbi:unnamed protein product [Cochlearia groenlandica]
MGAATTPHTVPVINLSSNVGLPPQWSQISHGREDNDSSANSKSLSSKETRSNKSISEQTQHDGHASGGTETTSSNERMLNTPTLPFEATSPHTNKGVDGKEAEGKPNSPPLNTQIPAAETPSTIQALVHEVVQEQNVDIDTSTAWLVTYLSDSSPPPVFTNYEPTQEEKDLASLLLEKAEPPKGDLTPKLDNALFAAFEKTLEKHPFVRHITTENFTFDNAFILVLATPEAWISNLVGKFMEPLTGMLPHIINKAANKDRTKAHANKR